MRAMALIDFIGSILLGFIFLSAAGFGLLLFPIVVFIIGRSGIFLIFSFISLFFLYGVYTVAKDIKKDIEIIFRRK